MSDLLVEVFSEEIPARMQAAAVKSFADLITAGLTRSELAYTAVNAYVTPRRLTTHITGIPKEKQARTEEIKGPRVNGSPAAIQGFLKKNGIADVSSCIIKDIDGEDYYFTQKQYEGGETIDTLGGIITEAISTLSWPKSMRWGTTPARWVRPMHNILALYDGVVIPGACIMGPDLTLPFNDITFGHRFMSNGKAIKVTGFDDYKSKLETAGVMLDQNERRKKIWTDVQKLAADHGYIVKEDEKLLNEVVGLTEHPIPFMGTFDSAFLAIPAEVISTSMREHQRYFSVMNAQGHLVNKFITIANLTPSDGGKTIIYGNEKVLRARLSDAQFFFDQDKKIKLADYLPRLAQIRFHEKLGTMDKKAARLEILSGKIASLIGGDIAAAKRAALLCKADLVTGMVHEFPELQGVMGGYYARLSGEDSDVAGAISSHYTPAGPSDSCPRDLVAIAVAMADKLDNLVGFFSIGEKPTGSKDPFALRRAALGVIRMIAENNLDISLHNLLQLTAEAYGKDDLPPDILQFIEDRFAVTMKELGVDTKIIDAVMTKTQRANLVHIRAKIMALSDFIKTAGGIDMLAIIKRVLNIISTVKTIPQGPVAPDLFQEPSEKALFDSIVQMTPAYQDAISSRHDVQAMNMLSLLRPFVDTFFDGVMVMDKNEGIKNNRLKLVAMLIALYDQFADFKKLAQ